MASNILTSEQLKQNKEEARKSEMRQNVKSHCTKIRDGIRKNGTTSAHRAIWELFQNAGDLADRAEIKMTLSDETFVFAHKGKPFTYDSLCSLVKQVSSEEKEGYDTVGQYGTGFLTTHIFGLEIVLNGSMCISNDPFVYVDVNNFVIDRKNFDNIPAFIEDMIAQIDGVTKLMDEAQHPAPREWTELSYGLNEDRLSKVQTAIDESIKLMPYVLTFNDNIGSCIIEDKTRDLTIAFSKEVRSTSINDLHLTRVWIDKNGVNRTAFDCYYLQLHGGESRIILPLGTETTVRAIKDIPHLFVHFPLIGPEYFNVNFVFHSHRFTPEESRDNIIVPKNNDAVKGIAEQNIRVLQEMTQHLWQFLEIHVATWTGTIEMAALPIKDSGYTESETEEFYKTIKQQWVGEFVKLKLIEIEGVRYAMDEEHHPLVLESSLTDFLSEEENKKYISTLYPYAKGVALIPCESELLIWSKIIEEWNYQQDSYRLPLESIVEYVSMNKGESLHNILEMLVKTNHQEFFDQYALLPNRENVLKKRGELRDANSITEDLYGLVVKLDHEICDKFVNTAFKDIVELSPYTRADLRSELNSSVDNEKSNVQWNEGNVLSKEYERNLIELCSAFVTQNGESRRNRLMPVICALEGVEYCEKYIPAWPDDEKTLDIYRQIFIALVENQMRKIQNKATEWVKANLTLLRSFVDFARGDDFKNFCTQYAIYPDMNYKLHVPHELKRDMNVHEKLFDFYNRVFEEKLEDKCVHSVFADYYDSFAKEEYQYTPQSVAKEIQNKLSNENYNNVIVLDIIELTEKEDSGKEEWRLWFNDIYKQRESIRYNLGTPMERAAINRMMKRKNPRLLEKMAEVSERTDADDIVTQLQEIIKDGEDKAYNKMLGDFVEKHIQQYLKETLFDIGVSVINEQGGQDLILSKEGYDDYFIEIKSRWVDKQSVTMTEAQFQKAVKNPGRYTLISAQMWTFERRRAETNERIELAEFEPRIKACNHIGTLEKDLFERVTKAFEYEDSEICAVGNYEIRVPQKVFSLSFTDLINELKAYFEPHL
jgi:hypothetical protein